VENFIGVFLYRLAAAQIKIGILQSEFFQSKENLSRKLLTVFSEFFRETGNLFEPEQQFLIAEKDLSQEELFGYEVFSKFAPSFEPGTLFWKSLNFCLNFLDKIFVQSNKDIFLIEKEKYISPQYFISLLGETRGYPLQRQEQKAISSIFSRYSKIFRRMKYCKKFNFEIFKNLDDLLADHRNESVKSTPIKRLQKNYPVFDNYKHLYKMKYLSFYAHIPSIIRINGVDVSVFFGEKLLNMESGFIIKQICNEIRLGKFVEKVGIDDVFEQDYDFSNKIKMFSFKEKVSSKIYYRKILVDFYFYRDFIDMIDQYIKRIIGCKITLEDAYIKGKNYFRCIY
jgi:CRISPR/Cas system CMR-associated protein Cmr5 small subunit